MRHLRLLPLLFLACSPVLQSNGEDGGTLDAGGGAEDGGSVALDAGRNDAGTLDSGAPDSGPPDAGAFADLDLDGLGDAWELDVATRFLPVLSLHPQDGCPLGGLVFRLRPHPLAPDSGLIAVTYTYLFERDCGLTAHVGDNEAFGATIDPSRPPERGITALRAIAHQNTVCSRTSTCGTCAGLTAARQRRRAQRAPHPQLDRRRLHHHRQWVDRSGGLPLRSLGRSELRQSRQREGRPRGSRLSDAGVPLSASGEMVEPPHDAAARGR